MAVTQADLQALDEAIATGATKVRYGDKEVTYRSLAEMRAIRREMDATLTGTKRRRRFVGLVSRGV